MLSKNKISENKKTEIRNLLKDNKIEQVFEKFFQISTRKLNRPLMILKLEFEDLTRRQTLNLITYEEFKVEKNRIVLSLLNLLDHKSVLKNELARKDFAFTLTALQVITNILIIGLLLTLIWNQLMIGTSSESVLALAWLATQPQNAPKRCLRHKTEK